MYFEESVQMERPDLKEKHWIWDENQSLVAHRFLEAWEGSSPPNQLWSRKHSTSGITLTFLSAHQVLSGIFLEQNLLSKITQIFLPRSFFHCSKCWLESHLFLFLRNIRCYLDSEELNETEPLGPWSHFSLLSFLHWKILRHKELIALNQGIVGIELERTPGR